MNPTVRFFAAAATFVIWLSKSAAGPEFLVEATPGWGIDACVTRHISAEELPGYIELLRKSGVRWVEERDVGVRRPDGSYEHDVRDKLRALKAAGFSVIAYTHLPTGMRPQSSANALIEDLSEVYRQGTILGHDFAGMVDGWQMVTEADIGHCPDLPDRVASYQKALYLGIKAGASASWSGPEAAEARPTAEQEASAMRRGPTQSRRDSEDPIPRSPFVMMGAMALPPGPWLRRAEKNGLLDYTDAYNFHFYGHAADLTGVIAAHEFFAEQSRKSGPRSATERLPLWITECGINAVPASDFLNPERRALQAAFTVSTAQQALDNSSVAAFMPFILVHKDDPDALTISAKKPLPAWDAYARFTRTNPWPSRPMVAPPVSPNPVIMQWLPDNATTHAHKVSGSYRFMGHEPIQGELRLYNFSDRPVHGRLRAGHLQKLGQQMTNPDAIELAPMSCRAIPVTFSRERVSGYVYENWSADFLDSTGRKSSVAFSLETKPEAESADFEEVSLALTSVGPAGSAHRFDPGDEVAVRASVWQGVNGLQLKELPKTSGSSASLQIWANEPRRDPLRAKLAVAQLKGGLPSSGFLRLKLDRPMDRDFFMCVDLVDRQGQRFSIWENMGVSYFDPKSKDVWLNLADFGPYFWGRCTSDPRLNPEDIEEIQLRFYISKVDDPREISLMFVKQRKESK